MSYPSNNNRSQSVVDEDSLQKREPFLTVEAKNFSSVQPAGGYDEDDDSDEDWKMERENKVFDSGVAEIGQSKYSFASEKSLR